MYVFRFVKEIGTVCFSTYCKSSYLRWWIHVSTRFFYISHYAWVLKTRMRDLPLYFFYRTSGGILHGLSLPRY